METKPSFGQMLRQCREDADKSLRDLAGHLGWSSVYLSDIERGRRNPPAPEIIKKISAFIGCSVAKLLNQADVDRKRIEIPLTNAPNSDRAALALARRWTNLTEEQVKNILTIVEDGKGDYLE